MTADPLLIDAVPATAKRAWKASLNLAFRAERGQTVLRHRHSGPLRVQRPLYPGGGVCQVHMLHPPAGIVGGDELDVSINLDAGAEAQLLTPGASLIYRSTGDTARIGITCALKPGACLEYLPHETIHFNGARSRATTRIDLASDSKLFWRETHCFGRPMSSESFQRGDMRWRTDVYLEGAPFWTETTVVGAPNWIDDTAGMRSHAYSGTMLVSPVDPTLIDDLRAEIDDPCTVMTNVDNLLVIRYLGDDSQVWRATTEKLWHRLRPVVTGQPATSPRIWAT